MYNPHGCSTNQTSIGGTGILQQPEGCNLIVGSLTLPASREFRSAADWGGPAILIPQAPELLQPHEVQYVRWHCGILEDLWAEWEGPGNDRFLIPAPMTMDQVKRRVETRIYSWKWIYGGSVGGVAVAVTLIGLCLWKHRREIPALQKLNERTEKYNAAQRDSVQGGQSDGGGVRDAEPQARDRDTALDVRAQAITMYQ